MRKKWKCGCGKKTPYNRQEALRYITRSKQCNECGGEMHIQTTQGL